jgi:hypothetical protein
MSFQATLNTFKAAATLANAKAIVDHVRKYPEAVNAMSIDDLAAETAAQRIVADAKNPAKFREAMQRELRARYPGMNIDVI